MNWFWRVFYYILKSLVIRQSVARVRRKGILAFLKTLQAVRRALAGSLLLFFVLQLMVFAFVGLLLTSAYLFIGDQEIRLWVLFSVSLGLFLIPLVGILIMLSDKVWFEMSGAKKMILEEDSAA